MKYHSLSPEINSNSNENNEKLPDKPDFKQELSEWSSSKITIITLVMKEA